MRNRGPSPPVPSLMVGALRLLIYGPLFLSLLGSLVLVGLVLVMVMLFFILYSMV